jgi:hypothetical protein
MNCNKQWSREFVMERLDDDTKWIKHQFFSHIGVLVMEHEKSLLPATQDKAFIVKRRSDISKQIRALPTNKQLDRIRNPDERAAAYEQKRLQRYNLQMELSELKDGDDSENDEPPSRKAVQPQTYIMPCPQETCRGFVATNYTCGTCNTVVCKKCRAVKPHGHVCSEADVKTAKELEQNIKPCPKCMIPILKNGGCDQIWCTQCHVAFSWNTGEIDDGQVHNPHYYEWLTARGSNQAAFEQDNAACGEVPRADIIIYRMVTNDTPGWVQTRVMYVHNRLIHIQHVIRTTVVRPEHVRDNEDLRIDYLLDKIDEAKWMSTLMHREKRRMKNKAICDILDMTITVLSDFVRKVAFTPSTAESVARESAAFMSFYTQSLDRVIQIHGGSIPYAIADVFM